MTYVLVDPERRSVEVHQNSGSGAWSATVCEGDGAIDVPCLEGSLGFDAVYDGLPPATT